MRKFVALLITVALCVAMFLTLLVHGQEKPAVQHQQYRPQMETSPEVAHALSEPLSKISRLKTAVPRVPRHVRPIGRLPRRDQPTQEIQPDLALQSSLPVPNVAATTLLNVAGLGVPNYTVLAVPPDPNGAVGATQYVQWVNEAIGVFDKSTGAMVAGPVNGNLLFTNLGGPCAIDNDGDPIVQYDKLANRWVLTQFAVTGGPPFFQCVAVSTTSDARGTYNLYAFQYSNFNDYPKLAVWPDAYYITFNMFDSFSSFLGPMVCAYDRNSMLNGLPSTQQCGQLPSTVGSLLPSDLDGTTPPPAGYPNFLITYVSNFLVIIGLHIDWITPANSRGLGPLVIPVAAFSEACNGGACIPQSGTTQPLDSLGDRLMYRFAYRNLPLASPPHESLLVNHSVSTGTNQAGVRWYELRIMNNTLSGYQLGTYAPDSTSRWMGSIAMDKVGNIALGYSASVGTINPGIRYTGRVPTDPLGMMQGESIIINGTGSQTTFARWGDYSAMTVDPVDDCTFWYTNEYLQTTGVFNWSTRIASIKFPTCN